MAGFVLMDIQAVPTTKKASLSLSVIVCAKNELNNLKKLLPVILEQTYAGNFELILVNDASTDGTQQFLDEFAQKDKRLIPIHLKEGDKKGVGKKAALAFGIERAQYDYFVFTDGDCLPASNLWLNNMGSALQHSELVLGYGPLRNNGSLLGAICRWEAAQVAAQYITFSEAGHPYMAVGRNMAYAKSLYTKAEGFSKHKDIASGDDDLFVQSVRKQVKPVASLDHESFVYSEAPDSWKSWMHQKRRHLSTSHRYGLGNKLILAALGILQLLLFILLPIALIYGFAYTIVLLSVRLLSRYVHSYIAFKRLGSLDVWLKAPLYAFMSVMVTTWAHVARFFYSKPINWK